MARIAPFTVIALIPLYGRGKSQLSSFASVYERSSRVRAKGVVRKWRFTPQTCRSRDNARETLLEKLRFRYFSAGFRARNGFSHHELPKAGDDRHAALAAGCGNASQTGWSRFLRDTCVTVPPNRHREWQSTNFL
jgi:hypothetical protein